MWDKDGGERDGGERDGGERERDIGTCLPIRINVFIIYQTEQYRVLCLEFLDL